MSHVTLQLLTPDGPYFDGEVLSVQAPGTSGAFTILLRHAPIVSTLTAGKVKFVPADGSPAREVRIGGGIAEAIQDRVVILAESVSDL